MKKVFLALTIFTNLSIFCLQHDQEAAYHIKLAKLIRDTVAYEHGIADPSIFTQFKKNSTELQTLLAKDEALEILKNARWENSPGLECKRPLVYILEKKSPKTATIILQAFKNSHPSDNGEENPEDREFLNYLLKAPPEKIKALLRKERTLLEEIAPIINRLSTHLKYDNEGFEGKGSNDLLISGAFSLMYCRYTNYYSKQDREKANTIIPNLKKIIDYELQLVEI